MQPSRDLDHKRILVSGGAGFIGSWLIEALPPTAKITCVDDLSTGLEANMKDAAAKRSITFKKIDAARYQSNSEKYDIVIHLASRASPEDYQQQPITTLLANSTGTQNLLEIARRNDALFFFSSTSEVYGDAKVIPTPEAYWGNVNPVGPRSCYDEGKRYAEALITAYGKEYGLDYRIARVFNTYGPRLCADGAYARVVSRFIMRALRNEPIPIFGDGKQTRSFCYITDTVDAIVRMLTNRRVKGEIINVGAPHEITILTLAEKIKTITRSDSPIECKPSMPDDPRRRCPDITKAKKLLGWSPKIALTAGLKRTVEWMKTPTT